jgi:hypothetical protein
MNPRLRALCDLAVPAARESVGLHELYDGLVQDLSPTGVQAALARVGQGPAEPDAHDEAQLRASEAAVQTEFAVLQEHRRNPLVHLWNLDLSCYDRPYAPEEERADARRRQMAQWPAAVDAAIESLDRVPAPLATALLPAVRGLKAGLPGDDRAEDSGSLDAARQALGRLVDHIDGWANKGEQDAAIGGHELSQLMGHSDATAVDLHVLARRADDERTRLRELLADACEQFRPGAGATSSELVGELLADHPNTPEDIHAEAMEQIREATAFTLERDLLPDPGGQCLVGPAPPSRRWAMAMMSWSAPFEADGPSWYYVTPPDPNWPEPEQQQWLEVFSRTTLPAITVHEVTPGHYAHGRMLRSAPSDVRRTLMSSAFIEGWAHYGEELMLEEGFRSDDPRFAIGVAIEALVRVTRLAVSIGIHTGDMTMDEAVARFTTDAFLRGPAARSEALRAGYDPTYGRYTWGKLEIMALRDEAKARWGSGYSHLRFHQALLRLGAPALGVMGNALAASGDVGAKD